MKRIFVVDEARQVIDWISLIVKWELSEEFEIVGSALSVQQAIEQSPTINPDIVLMAMLLPGVSGLGAIHEIRKRCGAPAFILLTDQDRFEVPREAMGLGVVDCLPKPIMKDQLIFTLRSTADYIDRCGDLAKREMDERVREARIRGFVESAFLHGIMLGEHFGPSLDRYRASLGIEEPMAVVAAAAVLPPPGLLDPAAEARILHEKFRTTVHDKSRALVGPLIANYALVLMPLRNENDCPAAVDHLRTVIAQAHTEALAEGHLRLGFGSPKPLSKADTSWSEALGDLLGSQRIRDAGGLVAGTTDFENDEAFLESLTEGSPERTRRSLELMLEPFRCKSEIPRSARYRIASLFGSAYRTLSRRGLVECADASSMMDFEDLRVAADGAAFELAVRARLSRLLDLLDRIPRRSPVVSRAIAFVKENYSDPIGLEQTASAIGISSNRLSRLFCEETGKGFSAYLIDYRIEKAKEMLLTRGTSIKSVSISCGYTDPNYFSRLFKKVTGLTPTAFSSGGTETHDGKPGESAKRSGTWSDSPLSRFRDLEGARRRSYRAMH